MKSDPETRRVPAGRVTHVVPKLVFFLVAQHRESSDGRDELIVAERFEAGDGAGSRAERKRQREAEIRVARFGVMQTAGIKRKRSQPGGAEAELLADDQVQVIGIRSRAGRGKRGLLDQVVLA